MTATEKLSSFILETNLDKMPPEVDTITKRAIIDTVGVALAGSVHNTGRVVAALVQRFTCRPVAGVFGRGVRTSSPLAALANGTMAHILDYDDLQFDFQGHPSAVLVPVLLALGEEKESSGKEVMEAYVLGVEVWAKLSCIMPGLHLKGWFPSGVLGTVGAAAAAAKLLKLTPEQTTMGLGIACSTAGGLLKNLGTLTKPFQVGNAAYNGIMAALLAKEGLTASKNVLEGDGSFPKMFGGGEVSDVVESLGAPFAVTSPGISVKKYPSCGSTHRALDAILRLIAEYDIKPDEVQSITVLSNPVVRKILSYDNPSTALEGKFSMPFALAAALNDRRFGLSQFTDEKVNDPIIKGLMKKVTLSVYPDWAEGRDTFYSRGDLVKVELKNGKEYSREVLVAEGDAKNPLSEEDLLTKYHECARMALSDQDTERFLELVWKLEELNDMRELMQIATGIDLLPQK